MTPKLVVKDITKHHTKKKTFFKPEQRQRVLDQLSFEIQEGETVCLVGESGCGKTTLGKVVVRLTPFESGTLSFEGQDYSELCRKDLLPLRQKMQMIFQDPYTSLNPKWSLKSILLEGPRNFQLQKTPEEEEAFAQSLLNDVSLPTDALNRKAMEFSGGQRQRIAIARALSLSPTFLICDEIVSALDPSIQAQVLNLLKTLKEKNNLSLLFITHDLHLASMISDRLLIMANGKIVETLAGGDLKKAKHPYSLSLIENLNGSPLSSPF